MRPKQLDRRRRLWRRDAKAFALLVGLLCVPWLAHAEDYYHTEVSFGMGWANAFEKDIFNVPQDQEISGVLAFDFAARFHVSRKFAVGLNLYGYYKKTAEFTLVDPGGGTTNTEFEFNSGNIGAQVQYTFATGSVRPYTLLALNWVYGFIVSDTDYPGRLNFNGVSVGFAVGVGFMLTSQVMLSVEGLASGGVAVWDNKPFANSSSDDFDPSQYGFLIGASYFWGLATTKTPDGEEGQHTAP